MTTLETLRQQKAALDSQIAEELRNQLARKKALELKMLKEREAEIVKGTAEIKALMKKYGLSKDDVFNERRTTLAGASNNLLGSVSVAKTLEEMRQFYKQF